jgi:hypothetical protein
MPRPSHSSRFYHPKKISRLLSNILHILLKTVNSSTTPVYLGNRMLSEFRDFPLRVVTWMLKQFQPIKFLTSLGRCPVEMPNSIPIILTFCGSPSVSAGKNQHISN